MHKNQFVHKFKWMNWQLTMHWCCVLRIQNKIRKSRCSQGVCSLVGEADKSINSDSPGSKCLIVGQEHREGVSMSAWGFREISKTSGVLDELEECRQVKWRRNKEEETFWHLPPPTQSPGGSWDESEGRDRKEWFPWWIKQDEWHDGC